jgi:hypothetical protein
MDLSGCDTCHCLANDRSLRRVGCSPHATTSQGAQLDGAARRIDPFMMIEQGSEGGCSAPYRAQPGSPTTCHPTCQLTCEA